MNKKATVSSLVGIVIVAGFLVWWASDNNNQSAGQSALQNIQDASSSPVITPDYPIDIENQTYTIDDRKIVLKNGTAETPFEGSATPETTTLISGPAFTDLDMDGSKDAVVILRDEPGGSGLFYHVAVVLSNMGNTKVTNSVFLGDRIRIKSISVDSGEISIVILERKSDEPFSVTPTVERTVLLKLENGTLVSEE